MFFSRFKKNGHPKRKHSNSDDRHFARLSLQRCAAGGYRLMPASPPHIFSGKTAALLLHIRQHRVAPHKISGAKQMQTVIGEPLAHAARGRVNHL